MTGIGLRVISPVRHIVVFALAIGAHDETTHGGLGAVVGDVLDDGEARPAVGAVGEGVSVASVRWRQEFAPAVIAGGDVGGDQLVFALLGQTVSYNKREKFASPFGEKRNKHLY